MPDFRSLANNGVRNLTPYQPGKPVEEVERELGIKSSLKLASNENPLGASPKAIAAAQAIIHQAHIYPDGGCFEFKKALADFLQIQPEKITVGNGSENILELIIKAYLQEGDSAVISEYAFLTIPIQLQSYGVILNVAKAKNYGHDVDNMLAAIDDSTRVLFLVNPNNPTGTYTTAADFSRLMNAVPAHVVVVVDEAYYEYISQPDYPNVLSQLDCYPNLVITRTFSKVYGLAALRLGYALSSAEIADILNRTRLPFNVNSIASKAACAALLDQEHVRNSVKLNQDGMQQLEAGLRALKLKFIPSLCNFISIDVGDARKIYQELLHEGVIVRPLHAYNMPRHIRVTIGTAEENQRFLSAIKTVWARQTKASQCEPKWVLEV
jgi:histidinol-phosphate aminotransferase